MKISKKSSKNYFLSSENTQKSDEKPTFLQKKIAFYDTFY
jgi:hypothetical protein